MNTTMVKVKGMGMFDFVDSFKNGMATVKDHKGNFLIIDKEGNVLSNKRIEL